MTPSPSPAQYSGYLALEEDLDILLGLYGDLETQHRSETALYGDSGPAQGLRLEEVRRCIHELETALRAHPARQAVLDERERQFEKLEELGNQELSKDIPF
jgi:hypothetical protein